MGVEFARGIFQTRVWQAEGEIKHNKRSTQLKSHV